MYEECCEEKDDEFEMHGDKNQWTGNGIGEPVKYIEPTPTVPRRNGEAHTTQATAYSCLPNPGQHTHVIQVCDWAGPIHGENSAISDTVIVQLAVIIKSCFFIMYMNYVSYSAKVKPWKILPISMYRWAFCSKTLEAIWYSSR